MNEARRSRRLLYDRNELEALLDAMASRCAALLGRDGPLTVVGVLRRGSPLADALTERLVARHGFAQPRRLDLKIERYSDDLRLLHPKTRLTEDPALADLSLTGQTVLMVDDVLYRGHSLLRALRWLADRDPAAIRVAVLVDRCVATLPLHADVVGARLEVAPADVIECQVPPYESRLGIMLVRPEREPKPGDTP